MWRSLSEDVWVPNYGQMAGIAGGKNAEASEFLDELLINTGKPTFTV
jgi:hypothetical protein